jgi:uncharacterized protein (TIGR00369 family)
MSLWFAPFTLPELAREHEVGLARHLGIRFCGIGDDWLAATMPVAPPTHQPYGLLHGGASFALAGTVAGAAAERCVDRAQKRCVLDEINGNHLRGIADGLVTGTARALHVGARSQVWQVEILDPAARRICVTRLTFGVLDAR